MIPIIKVFGGLCILVGVCAFGLGFYLAVVNRFSTVGMHYIELGLQATIAGCLCGLLLIAREWRDTWPSE